MFGSHCCRGKAKSITYLSVCVCLRASIRVGGLVTRHLGVCMCTCVALLIQHAVGMHHIVTFVAPSGFAMFFYVIS